MRFVVEASSRRGEWIARTGPTIVGTVTEFERPDERVFLLVRAMDPEMETALLRAALDSTTDARYIEFDAERPPAEAEELGFYPWRRDAVLDVPTDPRVNGMAGARLPAGYHLVTADTVPELDLRLLDDELRQDVPGSEGWLWTPEDFHEETYGADFDASTYLVAIETATGDAAGLVRVWKGKSRRRLGLVAVRRHHRGRGLARAMVAVVFAELHARGVRSILAEIDERSVASNALFAQSGAVWVGTTVELMRPAIYED